MTDLGMMWLIDVRSSIWTVRSVLEMAVDGLNHNGLPLFGHA